MKLQWDLLLNDDTRFPRLLFFGEFSDEHFRYGINDQLQYCLYFFFGGDHRNIPVEPVIMANISLEEKTEEGRSALILTLLNNEAKNLFSDLIISIVGQTRAIPKDSSKAGFIALCNEWFELFEPRTGQLSETDLQGIFAELSFLKYLLERSRYPFNHILSSWKGPYGKGHDFELGENHFEIKGIAELKPFVQISSEYQLDYLSGQQLFLGVFEFGSNPAAKSAFSDLIPEIALLLRSVTGTNMNLFWGPLGKTGINYGTLQDYDQHEFAVKTITFYCCSQEDFPTLKRTALPDALRNIKY